MNAPPVRSPDAPPPIWQGTARHGDYAEVLSRNPNGTFQVRIRGQEQTRTERDVAYMTGMNKPALDAHLDGATQTHLTRGQTPSGPPIWQGTARHGDYAEVLSRNPNGTFQVRIRSQEQTRTERDVAYMTGMNKPELYAHLEGVMAGFRNGQPRVENGVDGAPEDGGSLSADDWFKHLPVRGSFGGELFDMSQLDAIEKELAEHGVELIRNADEFLAEKGIAGGFQALGPNSARFYIKANATLREVLHEMIHFRQFRDLGFDGYMALRKTGQHETQVWEWFLVHPEVMMKLNGAEQDAELANFNKWSKINL